MENKPTTREKCYNCSGSGEYRWGPTINGVTKFRGVCYRCGGKGHLTPEDEKRNTYYDQHVRIVHI
jgi:DnaJ-class molecular chaperone